MREVLAVIPARSGSKGIADKNIRICNGKPLLAYSIEHAVGAGAVSRTIVSTDSARYAEIAREYGAEVPFLRPEELSGDLSLDIEAFEHALLRLQEDEGYMPDLCVHLRPTHPVREPGMIDEMTRLLTEHPEWDSVRSVSPSPATPYKMWLLGESGLLSPVASCEIPDAYNAPRQTLPQVYLQNACVDVVRSRVILEKHSMTGERIGGYVQKSDFDIDSEQEFLKAELYLEMREKTSRGEPLAFCFDIDGVIAQKTKNNDYSKAKPDLQAIELINQLYGLGHTITLFTARGSATGINWVDITKAQMAAWGVKYSDLMFGKPAAHVYIDDRLLNPGQVREFIKLLGIIV